MKNGLGLAVLYVLALQPTAHAETLSFGEVWDKVRESSPAQEASRLKAQSVEAGRWRSANHWLPKIYLNAQTYQTNDPGSAFFGLLEQRKVSSQDFTPDSLNQPAGQTLTRGALGIDFALYEGGAGEAQLEMYDHMTAAEKLRTSQIQIDQYAEACLAYGSIAVLQKQRSKLQGLNDELTKLIKNYQLGQKSNPVGYSGLPGMKSLANRVGGMIEQFSAEEKASYVALREMGVKNESWSPNSFDARAFADRYLNGGKGLALDQSYSAQAGVESARAAAHASRMEKARYLPRIGAFAESYVFNGSRDTASGYTGGLYLQWNLFDPANYGRFDEAKLAAQAGEKFSQASIQQENAEREGLAEIEKTIQSNLLRLEDSDALLAEQSRVSSTLFRNGSINALQFVEILNRRTDLISQQSQAEMNLLKTAAERAKKSPFEIPGGSIVGGQK